MIPPWCATYVRKAPRKKTRLFGTNGPNFGSFGVFLGASLSSFKSLTWSGHPNSSSPRWHCSNSFSRERRIAVTWFVLLSISLQSCCQHFVEKSKTLSRECRVWLSPGPPTLFPWNPSSQRKRSDLPPKTRPRFVEMRLGGSVSR